MKNINRVIAVSQDMNIQIEASVAQLEELIAATENIASLEPVRQQIMTAIALDQKSQEDDVPKIGDHPIIDRFE